MLPLDSHVIPRIPVDPIDWSTTMVPSFTVVVFGSAAALHAVPPLKGGGGTGTSGGDGDGLGMSMMINDD